MTNIVADTFTTLARQKIEKEIMDYQSREKYWQKKAGHMAAIANWALVELLDSKPSNSTRDEAEDKLREVVPLLDFDEEEE